MTRPSWILPDGMEECLPDEAWAIEDGRRRCLDLFRSSHFGLIMPPMVEYLDALTSGVGQDLADQIMVIKTMIRFLAYPRFCMMRNAYPRGSKHGYIVGTVTDSHGLEYSNAQGTGFAL